jgi:hypothetical protein
VECAKFGEVRLREKYFKRVYERMAVEQKANEEAFTIGALAEYIFHSSPRDFETPEEREQSL